jgi:hypothetical protein
MEDRRWELLLIAEFVGTIFYIPPVFATFAESYLTVERANVSIADNDDDLMARLFVEGVVIPTDGTGGAFGYGILTDDGDAILVAHTHPGVLDSEDQRFIGDPIWHTHLMKLGYVQCGDNQGVVDITWQSPGKVRIDNNIVRISGVPTDEFKGWDSMDGKTLSMTLGKDVSDVVSFKLKPVFGQDGLEAVCVTDVRSVETEVNAD